MAKNRIDKAIETVPGFKRMFAKYTQYMQLHQRSEQTIRSYSYRFASICLHFGRTPETYTADEINDCLGYVMQQDKMNSTSSFKHIVYSCGLRQSELRNLRIEDIDRLFPVK